MTKVMNSISWSVSMATNLAFSCWVRQKADASSQVKKPSVWKSKQPMLTREPSTQVSGQTASLEDNKEVRIPAMKEVLRNIVLS